MVAIRRINYDVFIAYEYEDSDFAVYVKNELLKAKVKVWFDEICVGGGEPFLEKMPEGLDNSSYCIAICGRDNPSGYFIKETQYAENKNTKDKSFKVIPVLPPGCDLDILENFPSFLKLKKAIKFKTMDDHQALKELLEVLGKKVGRKTGKNSTEKKIENLQENIKRILKYFKELENEGLVGNAILEKSIISLLDKYKNKLLALTDEDVEGES